MNGGVPSQIKSGVREFWGLIGQALLSGKGAALP